eukprot:Skav206072  [mRNA]  locus=scaffold3247:365320:365586:+ [translate_table: standard]
MVFDGRRKQRLHDRWFSTICRAIGPSESVANSPDQLAERLPMTVIAGVCSTAQGHRGQGNLTAVQWQCRAFCGIAGGCPAPLWHCWIC